jgi:arylsulfatase A-like enzyme
MKIKGLYFYLLLITACTTSKPEEAIQAPNIILFLVDDMGWQDTSVGFWDRSTPFNKIYRTPNMERLAREGMKFTQAYATPVCSPTRVSLMTGMNATRHRVTNWTLQKDVIKPMETNHELLEFPMWNVNGITPDSTISHAVYATTLPEILQRNGYHTIHVGKAHFGAIGTPGENPMNLGFNTNIAGHAAGAPKSYYGTENFGNTAEFKDTPWPVPGLDQYHGKDIYLTDALTNEALKAVDESIKPFFLYMSYYAVHGPIMANPKYLKHYLDIGRDSVEASYSSMIETMDHSVGRVMDYLEENQLSDNTVILFMSDNGGLSAVARGGEPHTHNKPLASGKGSIREGGIREPMIVKWPKVVPPGSSNKSYLIIEDFFPSILEIAGINRYSTVQTLDGHSFVPLLKGEQKPQTRPLFWHFPNEWGPSGPGIGAFSAVRLGSWKLVYYHLDQSYELFNIDHDIGENINLASDHPEKQQELAEVLSKYLDSVDAQMPTYRKTGKTVPLPHAILN